jgi:DNA-binding NarL/FixJ family response regulator
MKRTLAVIHTVDRVQASRPGRRGCAGGPERPQRRADVIRVLLADDNAFVRSALADLLTGGTDMQVVASCADGDEVVEAALATSPDVVLLDVTMPRMGGLEAARQLLAVRPGSRVLFLTANSSASALREAREMGAVGYLLKDLDPSELCDAVRTVARGGTAWPDDSGVFRNSVTETLLADTVRDDATSVLHEQRGLWS